MYESTLELLTPVGPCFPGEKGRPQQVSQIDCREPFQKFLEGAGFMLFLASRLATWPAKWGRFVRYTEGSSERLTAGMTF